jgi:hypothetical protein
MSKRQREAAELVALVATIAARYEQPKTNKECRLRFYLGDDVRPYTVFFGKSRPNAPSAEYRRDFLRWLRRERAARNLPEIRL